MLGSVIEGGANGVGEDPRMLLHDDADTINPMPKMISETLSMKFFIVSSRYTYCQYRLVPNDIGHKLSKSGSRQIQGKLRQRSP